VKRDNDLMRKLLFEFEANEPWLFDVSDSFGLGAPNSPRAGHVYLLCDAGLLEKTGSLFRLTNSGHHFLDAIRDDTIWNRTKDGAAQVGGMTLKMMGDLAIANLKQEFTARVGVNL